MPRRPDGEWVPSQVKESEVVDFRAIALGPKGVKQRNKRKLEDDHEAAEVERNGMEEDQPQQQEEAAEERDEQAQRGSKRQKADDTTYRPVSGKTWKKTSERAALTMKPKLKTTWEQRMTEKAAKKQLLGQKREVQEANKAKRKEIATAKQAARDRKKANQAKSAVVQKITNSATLKKMMKNKKQKKLLKKADTN